MTPLPPLTEKIDRGAHGGHEFERLMHRLLLRHADRYSFLYRPVHGAGGDAGVDGIAPDGGVPGLKGPVIFQFKWLFDDVHKGSKARQIRESFERAQRHPDARHWVLVTPWDLKPSEDQWLRGLPVRKGLRVHHWGQTKLEKLFEDCPSLFARYHPHEARHHLDGYDGHEFKTFAGKYRSEVALAHGKLRTLGLPPETLRERDATHEIRLRDIFVPLKLVPEGGETESLADVLRTERSFVVLGDPGTGKSTLLAFLALLFAGEAELPGFQAPKGVVPLHVPLRDFVLLRRQRPDLSFLEYFESRARSDYFVRDFGVDPEAPDWKEQLAIALEQEENQDKHPCGCPVDVYSTAFSWEVRCRAYAENGGSLTGVRGALLLAHAAFATLMTGLKLDGPVWLKLLDGRDRDDALVEGSYLLFEICSFRDGEENFRRLRELAASAPVEKRPVFEAAGLLG